MNKIKAIAETMNEAISGGFVGITDYVDQQGRIISVVGNLGFSYGKAKDIAIQGLEDAIANGDFDAITVKGQCKYDLVNECFNSRKRNDVELRKYVVTFDRDTVIDTAKMILEDWKNPVKRQDNKVELTNKELGASFNTETCNVNFSLMVQTETYKGMIEGAKPKEENTMPESKLKQAIRKRFEKRIKSYTIGADNFKTIKINHVEFTP